MLEFPWSEQTHIQFMLFKSCKKKNKFFKLTLLVELLIVFTYMHMITIISIIVVNVTENIIFLTVLGEQKNIFICFLKMANCIYIDTVYIANK